MSNATMAPSDADLQAQLADLAAAVAQATAVYARFMADDYPQIAAVLAMGQAKQRLMQNAVDAMRAFVLAHPDVVASLDTVTGARPASDAAAPETRH